MRLSPTYDPIKTSATSLQWLWYIYIYRWYTPVYAGIRWYTLVYAWYTRGIRVVYARLLWYTRGIRVVYARLLWYTVVYARYTLGICVVYAGICSWPPQPQNGENRQRGWPPAVKTASGDDRLRWRPPAVMTASYIALLFPSMISSCLLPLKWRVVSSQTTES